MIQIIADTLSCINVNAAREANISLLPQIIIFGEVSYRDDTEIDTKIFLQKLKSLKELPKTAAPAPSLYHPVFKKVIEQGDTPFVICPTSELSGTYRSALVAARDFPETDIRIVDTRLIGAGLGFVVRSAVHWAADGLEADELEKRLLQMASRERTYFMVATLEYLHKGGRIGGVQALLGSVLQVKPILQLRDGKVEPAGSQCTRKKAISYLHQLVRECCPHHKNAFLSVMHGDVSDDNQEVTNLLTRITGVQQIPVFDLPASILVHGVLASLASHFLLTSKTNGSCSTLYRKQMHQSD